MTKSPDPAAAPAKALPSDMIRLADLNNRHPRALSMAPDAAARRAVAAALDLSEVRKLRLDGQLEPLGRTDWRLVARLGATVVQPCVVTLDPVVTRIDEDIIRTFVAEMPEITGSEEEMPEDDSLEPLPATLDLGTVLIEALSLAVPAYPRSDGAGEIDLTVTAPGAVPLTRGAIKPFAGLAGLRDAMAETTRDTSSMDRDPEDDDTA